MQSRAVPSRFATRPPVGLPEVRRPQPRQVQLPLDILKEKWAGYGERIFHSLSGKLTAEFGRGFTKTNLFNMVRFAEAFGDAQIVHAMSEQLSWTHLRRIIYLDDPLKRDFYSYC
ncbi:MAG: hypothetical protein C5B50_00300 [Verrucomicrobia bacterium]|nr:MAG: hypothetical protein C5B50_00300 [Verrucomicrobiota bacterium]